MLQMACLLDLTGSMHSVSKLLSQKLSELAIRLESSIPGTEMSVTGIGNYADGPRKTVTTGPLKDLTQNLDSFKAFLSGDHRISGGGSTGFKGRACSACYELGLQQATQLKWRHDAAKVVIVCGDEESSNLSYGVDWRKQVTDLAGLGVLVYGVQCLGNRSVDYFYSDIAKATGGNHLQLDQFSDILELVTAVALRQKNDDSLDAFAEELKARAKMSRSMLSIFSTLSGTNMGEKLQLSFTDYSSVAAGDLKPVDPSRFQVMDVPNRVDIKGFVQSNGCSFRVGKAFYELTKT